MGPHLLASELMKEKSGETDERKLNTESYLVVTQDNESNSSRLPGETESRAKQPTCQTRGDSTFNDSDSDSDSSTPFRFRFRLRLQSSWLRFRLRFRLQHYFSERFRLRFRLRFNSDSSTPYILIMTPELYKF